MGEKVFLKYSAFIALKILFIISVLIFFIGINGSLGLVSYFNAILTFALENYILTMLIVMILITFLVVTIIKNTKKIEI